jgi:hypothetical protein|nr:MAG TPA: hypothetical protein [Bacteriophage sp.]
MDIVELVKDKLGSVLFGDVTITVGGDIVNVYCRHCVGDVEYGDKTYREWDACMIQLRLSQGILDGRKGLYDEDNGIEIIRYTIEYYSYGRMQYELDIVDDKTVYRDVETRNDVLRVMVDLASEVGVHSIVDVSNRRD